MSRRSLRAALLAASVALVALAGCGGGGGGGDDQAAESTPRLLAFNADSQVAAAYEPTRSNAGYVFMRDADSGRVNQLVMRLQDGTLVTLSSDAQGRLTRIVAGNERITISEYTATTAKLTYFKGGVEVKSETVSLTTGAAVASARKSQALAAPVLLKAPAKADAAQPVLERRSDFIRDIGRFTEGILRIAGETLTEKIREVGRELEFSESKPVARLGKKLSCVGLTQAECAPAAIERLPGLTHKIHIGLYDYNERDLEILRDKDEVVPAAPAQPTKPDDPTKPTEPTKPDEPEEPVGLAAHDAILETWANSALTQGLFHSGAEAFAMISAPKNGTISAFDKTTGIFTYTPKADFTGTDTFRFVVTRQTAKGTQTSAPGTVTITVKKRAGLPGNWEVRSGGKVLGTVAGSDVPTSNGGVTSGVYGKWLRMAIENHHKSSPAFASVSTAGAAPTYTTSVTYKPGWGPYKPALKDEVQSVVRYDGCDPCSVNTSVSYTISVLVESVYTTLPPSTITFQVIYVRTN